MRFTHCGRLLEFNAGRRMVTLVMRGRFDKFLADKAADAGAEICDGERIARVRVEDNCVEVVGRDNSWKARAVIGADGINSVVAQHVRQPLGTHALYAAMGVEVPVPEKRIDEEYGDTVEIETGMMGQGYGWVFPKKKLLSFGYGACLENASEVRGALLDYLRRHGFAGARKILGHLIPVGGTNIECWGKRTLLCGDAAGLADPFHGEGIRYAIRSGQLAGEFLADALETDSLSEKALGNYGSLCYEEFGRELRWARRLARLLYADFGLFFKLTESSPYVLEQYAKTLTGELSYKEFFLWAAARFPAFAVRHLTSSLSSRDRPS